MIEDKSDREKVDRIFISEMHRQRQQHAIPHSTIIEDCSVTWYPGGGGSHFVKKGRFGREGHYVVKYHLSVGSGAVSRSGYYEDYFNIPCDKCFPGTWEEYYK